MQSGFKVVVVSLSYLDSLHSFRLVLRKAVYVEHLSSQHQGSVSQKLPSPVQLGLAAGWTVPRSPAVG